MIPKTKLKTKTKPLWTKPNKLKQTINKHLRLYCLLPNRCQTWLISVGHYLFIKIIIKYSLSFIIEFQVANRLWNKTWDCFLCEEFVSDKLFSSRRYG